MTFQELQSRIGAQIKADWRKHDNRGGWIHKSATVDGGAFIGERAIVFSGRVYGDARVFGNARVYGDARVSGDAWVKSPLFIVGSRHSLTNAKHGYIQIGCHCKTIDWWLKNYKDIGQQEGYTSEETKEYGLYIQLFKRIGK